MAASVRAAKTGRVLAAVAPPLVAVLAALAGIGYLSIDFGAPMPLWGDSTFAESAAKAYAGGQGFRFNAFLGYPGIQDNAYFPSFDFSYRLILFVAARLSRDPFAAIHALYIGGTAATVLGCYASLRRLRIGRALSAAAGAAFMVTPYFAARALGHDFLSLPYSVPFGATLAILVACDGVACERRAFRRDPYVFLACAAIGTSGLYYAFFSCMFLLLGAVCGAAASRRAQPLIAAAAMIGAIFALIVLTGYGTALPDVVSGAIPQVARFSFEQLLYGLNVRQSIAALQPYVPELDIFSGHSASLLTAGEGFSEWPGLVLTLVILSCPVLVVALALARRTGADGRWGVVALLAASYVVFGILYAVPGGLGFWFAVAVAPTIRATGRVMPFLTYFGLVLAVIPLHLLASRRAWRARLAAAVGAAVLVASAWPATNALAAKQRAFLARAADDLASIRSVLAVKDALGLAAVLQLPHVLWPEQPPIRDFDPYAHLDPYILDAVGAGTRWSYGSTAGQDAFGRIAAMLDGGGPMAEGARGLGFDAILIETRAYDRPGLAALAARLGQDGGDCMVFEDDRRMLFALRQPRAAACLGEGAPAPASWRTALGSGWSVPEGDFVWTDGPEASIDLVIPVSPTAATRLRFAVSAFLPEAVPSRTVQVWAGDDLLAVWRFDEPGWTEREVEVPAGRPLSLTWRLGDTPSPKDLGLSGDPRHVGLALRGVTWQRAGS